MPFLNANGYMAGHKNGGSKKLENAKRKMENAKRKMQNAYVKKYERG
jgi:hypothetical protein